MKHGTDGYGSEARSAVANSLATLSLNKNNTSPEVEYKNGKAYIGPLKATFSGGTPKITVEGTEANWVTKNTNGSYNAEQSGSKLTSGQVFYAVTAENNVKNKQNVNVKVELTANKYKSRVILSTNKSKGGQSIMFHGGTKATDSTSISWSIEQSKKVTIQKQDANGNALKVTGIKFEIYDSNNAKVGTLTTTADGKTNAIALKTNQNYTIKETYNGAYGYKNASIAGATISSGGKIISVSNGAVTFSVSADSTISIKNAPQLGNLTLQKKGNNGESLKGVQFVLYKGSSYLKLNDASVTTPIETSNSGLDITKYNVTNVDSPDKATKFITNSSGKIVINNLEIYSAPGKKYEYWLYETANDNYGYKNSTIGEVTVSGGTKEDNTGWEDWIHVTLGKTTTIIVDNNIELANLEIQKVGENETKLENVEFVIQRDASEYLQLKNSSGAAVTSIKGTATINSKNVASSTEYSVAYVSDKNAATRFITDPNGKITIKNVEVNKSKTSKYSYTAYEIANPNYGYGSSKNAALASTVTNLTLNQTAQIKIANTINLGNLQLKKYDEENPNIKLENVGFAIEISPSPSNSHAYLALYDQNGNIVPSIKGTAIINSQNIANATEYKVSYYCTNKTISEMTENEKANITTFITGSDGILTVNNLEVYKQSTENKYTYKLIETTNENYGYVVNGQNIQTTLESNSTVSKGLSNEQVLTKISGYVWVEKTSGKANNYDLVYTEGESSSDIKLIDLYITDANGNVTNLNQVPKNAKGPVEIKLYNNKTNTFIKTQPDIFSKDGQYTFMDVIIEELEDYEVVFVYDGFYYTTVVEQLQKDNGSKVKEVSTERKTINNKFGTVKDDNSHEENKGQAVSVYGNNITTIEYTKESEHMSTVKGLSPNTTLSANTNETKYNLKEQYELTKDGTTKVVDGLYNVNMGIVLREQPKLAIGSDIYSVSVNVNNKNYNYYYNGRQQHYNNLNNDEVGVKFEQENSTNRYTRTVYSSDVEAYANGRTTMEVSLIYKMQITNQSGTLTSVVKEIANYFDADYTIESVGLSISSNEIGNIIDLKTWSNNITENINVEYQTEKMKQEAAAKHKSYNSVRIPLSESGKTGLALEAGQSKYIYIKYKLKDNAIKGLLNGESTYHNATEIMSYSTYYGDKTGKQTKENGENEYFVTEQRSPGEIYAGVDRSSQPGNIKIKLIYDTRDGKTPILDTKDYEDDTTSAPSLLLEATSAREISGVIFEDKATGQSLSRNEKLGDGIYNEQNEKTINGVKVELYEAEINGQGQVIINEIAKFSNGEDAIATIDAQGKYTFGYYDETSKKYVGILPGDYVIQFTYNNESYIIDSENKYLNVNDYKSTIITSNIIKAALEDGKTNSRWYTVQEAYRYSDAVDDLSLRSDKDDVKYSTYQNSFSNTYVMEARTPFMNIGVEFTEKDEADALRMNRIEKLENVDFGIIERPDANMIIEKKITGLEVTTQTGTNIIPKGDPSNPNESMQYVKTGLDGLVPVEIEPKLLQGAILNLEYSISVENACQKDYEETDYYLYGTNGKTLKTPKVEKVVDYLDATMELDLEQNPEGVWKETTADYLKEQGLIRADGEKHENVYEELKIGNYHILITEQFNELQTPGDTKTVKLYATKYLATSNNIEEENHVEIIELSGGRTIKESIPGNYNPATSSPDEPDDDMVKLQITSPTGTAVNYTLYIIAAVATFTILVSGIIIIKKKIIK